MTRRYGFARGILAATVLLGILLLAAIQLASDSLNAVAAERHALPTVVPDTFGQRVYEALDRIAPAPYVESTLATRALAAGDVSAAEHFALRLPAMPTRDELLATIADRRGETKLAYEYYFAAADVATLQGRISLEEATSAPDAYLDEGRLKDRLVSLRTHPDAVAEAYWHLGEIATTECLKFTDCKARGYLTLALRNFERALGLAPLNVQYALYTANTQLSLGSVAAAEHTFRGGLSADPASAEMLAGLGIVALARNDRATALGFAARARAISPDATELAWLQQLLK